MTVTDPEVLDFIAKTEAAYPADANLANAAENRRCYDAMCAGFRSPRPESVRVDDRISAGVRVRRYRNVDRRRHCPVVLFFHGGGFVVGSLLSHDDICSDLCARTGLEVVSVDYRLAPESVYPSQLDDIEAVWRALAADGRSAVVAGDSAGGNLSAALCVRMRSAGGPMPLAQVLIYPSLGGDGTSGSYVLHSEAPLLRTADLQRYMDIYVGGEGSSAQHNPEVAPLRLRDLSGLPPAFVVTADVDPLRDDGRDWVAKLRASGVAAEWRNEPQLIHGYLRARHCSKRAAASFEAICEAVIRFAI